MGAASDDYSTLLQRPGAGDRTQHTLTGLSRGIIANRVSYTLGLSGPSMTIDAAQASALTAVHAACESLRTGESELALAGGVNLALALEAAANAAEFGALSPDGECFTFDARANGYVRGEGGGVVVLKPLAGAVEDGDPVYCVIRGSAVNNDGATEGLTVPSARAQEAVVRRACERARVDPADVQYVELHGTGTKVGDPIEASALARVLGAARPEGRPLAVGSVKTNIGHLEGASGIAGLIKTALSIRNRELPPSLNFATQNPHIPLEELNLRVQSALESWPSPAYPLIAGVSSFGMGGTNCHVVLADGPEPQEGANESPSAIREAAVFPWIVSAKTKKALHAQARQLLDHLGGRPEAAPLDIGYSLACTRSDFDCRAAIVGRSQREFLDRLAELAGGKPSSRVAVGRRPAARGQTAFLFSGQGAQRAGMGRELYEALPEFAEALEELGAHLEPKLGFALREAMFDTADAPGSRALDETGVAQPALFAFEVALFRQLERWGVAPDAVAGHSVGELAAAHVAGVLSLEDACVLVAARARMMQSLPAGGAMLAVQTEEARVREAIAEYGERVGIAAVNSPVSTVVSGEEDAVADLGRRFAEAGWRTRRLRVGRAFHSARMDPMLADFREAAEGLSFHPPRLALVSNLTGGLVTEEVCTPEYWVRHVREAVRFADGVAAMREAGVETFVEVGPAAALSVAAEECLAASAEDGQAEAVALSGGGAGEAEDLAEALGRLYVRGHMVDWASYFASYQPRRVDLPTYPFQRQRHWLPAASPGNGASPGQVPVPATGQDSAAADPQDPAEADAALALGVTGLARPEQERLLRELLRTEAAAVLGYERPEDVDLEHTFKELGFDSLTSMQLRNRLNTATGLRLPATLTFEYPTPQAVVHRLRAHLLGEQQHRDTPAAAADEEPIAIVATACRYPGGVRSPEDLWRLVADGTDVIGELPADRGWDLAALYDPEPGKAGKSYVRHGGFLDAAADFDAEFFGISPREALAMDPQQRLLLEVAWEAVERSRLAPDALRRHPVGVFAGAIQQEYGPLMHEAEASLQGFVLTGQTSSVLSGRVAYTLGLEGPALTVDTACSSSLVAIHQAMRALHAGECSLALAGGVTVMATPGLFTEFSRQRGLASDGRSKSFAAAADGTSWAEGAGMVLLERLGDARANGHPVLAVIRGSAVNQDGASNGLTAPSGPAQQRVIRQALANARLGPGDVDAVEAHGTGTTLGDPIEASAILATYGRDRPAERPLRLGSLKSNIGHSQAAAGIGGVIKMVMAMRHGTLPRTLHVDEPTPHADWSDGAVELLTEEAPWPQADRPRRAAVSSFGISGTNAHIILEQAPADEAGGGGAMRPRPRDTAPDRGWPLVLSARGDTALQHQAERLRGHVGAAPEIDLADLGYSLATTRTVFEYRAALVAGDRNELLDALAALASGREHAGLLRGQAASGRRCVFVFPGQGSQWEGMARELLEASPAFRDQIAACEKALRPHVDWSLTSILRGSPDIAALERVDVLQPALWAVMVSLAELWRSYGVRPDAVVGHSQGEIAAACAAGALSLDDAAAVAALRSQAIAELADRGGMVSVPLPAEQARQRLEPWQRRISVATINGPSATVVSGDPEALGELVAVLEADNVEARWIPVDYASHSPQMEEIREPLLTALAGISPRSAEIPFYSTVTGEALDTANLGADYWYRNLRRTVEFEKTTRKLLDSGYDALIEVSPHPVLSMGIQESAEASDKHDAAVLGTLRRGEGGLNRFLTSLCDAHVRGVAVDWHRAFPGARPIDLPTYPFQRERFWVGNSGAADTRALGIAEAGHPLLGAAVELADGAVVLTGRLSLDTHPWLADHAVEDTALVPGTALVELAIQAGDRVACPRLDELVLESPLTLPEGSAVQLRLMVHAPEDTGRRAFTVHSRTEDAADAPWRRNATGALSSERPAPPRPVGAWPPPGAEPVDLDSGYHRLADRGYGYGPTFQGLKAAWQLGAEIFAEVELPAELQGDAEKFGLHPALLDAGLHALLLTQPFDSGRPLLPFTWNGVALHAAHASTLKVRMAPSGPDAVSVTAADASGAPIAEVAALVLRPLPATGSRPGGASDSALFRLEWAPRIAPQDAKLGQWFLLGPYDLTGVPGPHYRELSDLRGALDAGAPAPDVVFTACAPHPAPASGPAMRAEAARVLGLLRDWLAEPRLADSLLVVVTRGAAAAAPGDQVPALGQAPITGLLRTAQSENPGRFALLDADTDPPESALAAAMALGEPQLALRGGRYHVPRLARAAAEPPLSPPAEGPWRLEVASAGTLENLALIPATEAEAPLAPGQVRVSMRACGVNFRDVLLCLGMYPGADAMGSEGAGVVVEVAPDVTDMAPGDRVMGIVERAFGPVAVADRLRMVPIPEGWSFQKAASVPVVFLTAYQALHDVAGLKPGESVLVHAAAGGVGMAAVQLARQRGAEVFATAHPGKWDTLRAMGLDDAHIASSRTREFEEKFRNATGGRGVDVVLNSLAADFTDASLRLLAPGGRFAEIGKTDLRDEHQLAADYPGIAYQALSLADAPPARVQEMFTEVLAQFQGGALRHLPTTTWDLRRAPEAFRHLREARHVGKIVLTVPPPLDPEGTVLITGGTGTLGALTARHLVAEHGVRHLLLVSRRGPDAPGAAELERELKNLGVGVTLAACDVADHDATAALLGSLPAAHPLTAVVHTAGVLDDATVTAMTGEQLEAVMRPKADAALTLHRLTQDRDLSAFILFSSVAGVIGNAGQGNYAAANTFLDALAEHRLAEGLPAISLAWGLWEEASGMTGHLGEADRARMQRAGLTPLSTGEALALFDTALASGRALAVPTRLNPAADTARSPVLADLPGRARPTARSTARDAVRPPASGHRPAADGVSLPRQLAAMNESERDAALLEVVRTHTAQVLGRSSPRSVPTERPFKEMGFDSLTSVELRNRLGAATGLRLPATLVFDHPTPAAVRGLLSEELAPEPTPDTGTDDEAAKAELYDALKAVPLDRLRETGLADAVLGLARDDPGTPVPRSGGEDIDGMNAEDLVRLALEDLGSAETQGFGG